MYLPNYLCEIITENRWKSLFRVCFCLLCAILPSKLIVDNYTVDKYWDLWSGGCSRFSRGAKQGGGKEEVLTRAGVGRRLRDGFGQPAVRPTAQKTFMRFPSGRRYHAQLLSVISHLS